MKTIADLKARLVLGAKLEVTAATHSHRYLNVVRQVVAVRSRHVLLAPLGEEFNTSTLSFPGRSETEFLSEDEFKITFWEGNATTYKFVK